MGVGASSTTQVTNTDITNQIDNKIKNNINNIINSINQTVNKSIQNTIIEINNKSSSNVKNKQSIKMKNIKVAGDIDIGEINQTAEVKITFEMAKKAMLDSNFNNTLMNDIKKEYSQDSKNTNDMSTLLKSLTEQMNKMDQASLGSLLPSIGSTQSYQNNNFKTQNSNRLELDNMINNTSNLVNKIHNITQNNLTNKNNTECIQQLESNQKIDLQNIQTGQNFKIKSITQKSIIENISKCIFNDDIGQKFVENIGLKLDEKSSQKIDSSNKVQTQLDSTTKIENKSQTSLSSILSVIGAIIIIVAIIVGVYTMKSKKNGKGVEKLDVK